jgi:tetratricopeptide (TPR) repeat protein
MSDDKTKFYERVLELEPGSRLFFPLARHYYEQKNMLRAKQVLSEGLERHPDHFEARLLFAAVLNQLGDKQKARVIYGEIFDLLKNNQDFWEDLSDVLSGRGEKDLSLAAAFFARSGRDNSLTWADVLKTGLDNLGQGHEKNIPQAPETAEEHAGTQVSPGREPLADADHERENPAQDTTGPDPESHEDEFEDPEEWAEFDIDNEARTKSMADILFGQEEYAKAHDIYRELWHKSLPGNERRELERMMARSRQAISLADGTQNQDHVSAEDAPGTAMGYDKNEAIKFLMTLADRLEAKSV